MKTIGVPEPPSFQLSISGHGFGLLPLNYDVGKGSGSASEGMVRVEITRQNGTAPAEIQRVTPTILSTVEIRVKVELGTPLASGIYSVRMFQAGMTDPLAEKPNAFQVETTTISQGHDAGTDADGGTSDLGTGTSDDGGTGGSPDLGMLDAAAMDSGLGTFASPASRFRRAINLINPTQILAPSGTSFRLAVPHASLVAAGHALPNGSDIAVYFQGARLPHQWEDPVVLGTDQLMLVATLPFDLPPGARQGEPLVLYYGDAAAIDQTSDTVYAFAERFDADLNPNTWRLSEWARTCPDRRGSGALGSYCRRDDDPNNPLFRTLGTPPTTLALGQAYEATFWISGLSIDTDLTYFAVAANNDSPGIAGALIPAPADYSEFPPDTTDTYQDPTTNNARTFVGWRFPAAGSGFVRARVRFTAPVAAANLHLRYISPAGANPAAYVAVDDLAVRRVLGPTLAEEVLTGLAAEESR
ncbi:MAG: hypothetical protein U1E65_20380 [Myxococcota bacterium]